MKLNIACLFTLASISLLSVLQAAAPTQSTPAQSAQAEKKRRQDLYAEAKQALMDADRARANGDYTSAVGRYQFALDSVTSTGAGQIVYHQAQVGLAVTYSAQAQDLAKDAKFALAADLVRQAIELDPTNPAYPQQIEDLKQAQAAYQEKVHDPEGETAANPALADNFKDKVATVAKLLFQGDRYFETGQYELAETTYSKILILDPYSKAARARMDRMERYRLRAAKMRHEEYTLEKLAEVNKSWVENISPDIVVPEKQTSDQSKPSNRARIFEKLQKIKVDKINFDKLDVEQVIGFLTDKSKELDPDREGINFILRLTSNDAAPATTSAGTAPADAAATPSSAPIHRLVSINAENLPMTDLLNLITEETNLQFTVDDYAVYIRPSRDAGEFLTVRTFLAPPNLFTGSDLAITPPVNGGTGFSTVENVKRDVKKSLTDRGITFPEGTTATLLPGSGKLVVRNTPEQLDLIASLIDQLSQETPQVQIQAKIAEFTEDAYKAFAVNAILGMNGIGSSNFATGAFPVGGTLAGSTLTSGTALRNSSFTGSANNGPPPGLQQAGLAALESNQTSGNPFTGGLNSINSPNSLFLGAVISGRGLGVLINALNNTKGVSLLSAPSVTTQSTMKANIDIVQEFPYASNFQAPTLAPNNFALNTLGNNGNVIAILPVTVALPATPSEWTTKDVGVSLEVKPTVYPDKRIDLDITRASVIDFEGFINYGQQISDVVTTAQTVPTLLTNDVVNEPVFNSRSITTRLQVLDGQTVVLGGLIREDTQEVNDKVPILGDLPIIGRAFQSKVSERTKRNLIFFITANLVRSNGKPQYMKTLNVESTQETKPISADPGALINIPATTEGGS